MPALCLPPGHSFANCASQNHTELLLNMKRWRVEEYVEVLGTITPETLTAFLPRMMSR